MAGTGDERLASFEHDVVAKWQPFFDGRALEVQIRMVTASARKD